MKDAFCITSALTLLRRPLLVKTSCVAHPECTVLKPLLVLKSFRLAGHGVLLIVLSILGCFGVKGMGVGAGWGSISRSKDSESSVKESSHVLLPMPWLLQFNFAHVLLVCPIRLQFKHMGYTQLTSMLVIK